jgi:hypothetical protein
MLGTNLLSQRYLMGNAWTMIALSRQISGPSTSENEGMLAGLEGLKTCFIWELRVIIAIPVGIAFYYAGFERTGIISGLMLCVLLLLTNAAFSIGSIMFFTDTMHHSILKMTEVDEKESLVVRRLRSNATRTVFGASLTATSASVLYINAFLSFAMNEPFWKNPWLHVSVFGSNADSVLNDLGMLIISGAVLSVDLYGRQEPSTESSRNSRTLHSPEAVPHSPEAAPHSPEAFSLSMVGVVVLTSPLPRMFRGVGTFTTRCYRVVRQLEILAHRRIRHGPWTRYVFAMLSIAFVILGMVLPLLMTNKTSFLEASNECREGRRALGFTMRASSIVFPAHLWNSASASASLLCFLNWLCKSPHITNQRECSRSEYLLDRKLGACFGLQLYSNIAKLSINAAVSCTTSVVVYEVLSALFFLVFGVLSVFWTNILCHRYLLEKVKAVMTDPGSKRFVDKMESALNWELRVVLIVPIAVVAYLAGHVDIASMISALGVCLVILFDSTFSVSLTLAFLVPMWKVLRKQRHESNVQNQLQIAAQLTLFGSSLALFSSTTFYLTGFGFYVLYEKWSQSIWLNAYVFGGNVDSILCDIGLLVVSTGVAFVVLPKKKRQKRRACASKKKGKVVLNALYLRGSKLGRDHALHVVAAE